jgi:hypothetical protein
VSGCNKTLVSKPPPLPPYLDRLFDELHKQQEMIA